MLGHLCSGTYHPHTHAHTHSLTQVQICSCVFVFCSLDDFYKFYEVIGLKWKVSLPHVSIYLYIANVLPHPEECVCVCVCEVGTAEWGALVR